MSLFASSVNRSDKGAAVSKTLGVILIVLGLFGLAWGGFTYTTREKAVDIGPIHTTRENQLSHCYRGYRATSSLEWRAERAGDRHGATFTSSTIVKEPRPSGNRPRNILKIGVEYRD